MMPPEEWRPVFGYEDRYMVSNLGNIKRLEHAGPNSSFVKSRVLKPQPRPNGYMVVMLFGASANVGTWRKIHIIVARAFLGERPHKFDINHKDGNKANNQLSNLEYCTRSANMLHAYALGLVGDRAGAANGRAKLSEEDVREVWRIYHEEGMTQLDLADLFCVSPTVIGDILHVRTWRHLNLECIHDESA